mmetsp:Transcript_10634/g.26032  ORF Transcript_10634/g.26032 Transcript_10634/m.26032 type:complete len:1014 (+) Transcript_10634:43-3084(+)
MKPPRSRRLLRMRRRAVALGVVLSSLYGMAIAPSSGFLGRSVFNGMDASKTRLTHLRPPAWRHTPEPADVFRTEHIRGVATHWRRPRSKTGRIFVMDPNREEEYEDERMKNLSTLSDEQIKEMNLNSLSVGDIRNELQARGWTTNGNKSELIDRLVHAVNAGESKEGMERDASVEEYLRSRLESCTVIELKDGLKARGLAGYGSRQEIQQRIMDELSDETILDLLEEIDGMEEEEEENEIANNADTVRPVDQVDEVWTLNQESDQCDQQDEQPENMGELTNYPGVTWKGKTGKWEAVTMNENKQQFVGLFKSEEDAWAAITKRREKLGWPQIVLESGYKYAVFPGTNLHPEKHLWTASTSHWGITENLGEFASRSEAWFEIQRVRREKGWPELRPFEPVSQNMEKEKKPTQPETAEISPQAETESASIPDVSAPEPASDISNASAPDSTLDIADSAASTESQSEITAVSAFGGDDDDDYDETIQNSNLLVLSVSELKAEAKKRDLSGRGRKIDIVARLERSMAEPDSEFDKPAENALERLQKLTAILEETINMKVSFDDFPNISEEELREYSKSNDTYMSRLAELVIEDETKVASAQSEKLVKSGKGLHPLEDALDLSSQDLQTLRSIAKKKIKAEEKKRKDELLKQEESQRKFDLETPPPDDEVAFDWDRFNADVARLRAQNRSLQELDPEYVKAQKKIESNQNMMSEVLGSKKLFGDEQDIAELVKIMDLANMASQAEEKKSTDKDDPESNPIDGPVNEAWDQARVEAGEEPPLPKLKPSDRKLADRLITLFLTRDQREWPELIKDSDIWKASADNVFVRLQQKIRAVEDLQDEWILRVCERDLKNVHAMFLKGEGPFAPTTFSPAVLKRMASDWAASGPESMEKNDLELCDRLAGFFEARDPSEWFRILRESKSWPAIAERFFYRLRSRIRAERGEKRRKQLIEMRQILRECHQQVFGVEAPDTASLETFGADYRNFDKGQEDVDSNTRYYWNKVIGGSKRERRGDDGSK